MFDQSTSHNESQVNSVSQMINSESILKMFVSDINDIDAKNEVNNKFLNIVWLDSVI
jgi:hypothetical protein